MGERITPSPASRPRSRCRRQITLTALYSILLGGVAAGFHSSDARAQAAPSTPAPDQTVTTPVAVPTPPPAAPMSAAQYDAKYGVHSWNIPFPSYGDTLLGDLGGFRSTLAQYGIGVIAYSVDLLFQNLLNTPSSNHGVQVYEGQKFSSDLTNFAYITYDLSRYGIPDGQLVAAGGKIWSSWQPYNPDVLTMVVLQYYQTAFDRKLEIQFGYLSNGQAYVGTNIGGSLAGGTFGPSASIPYELGLSNTPAPAPGINLTGHFGRFYDKFGVQRSVSPTASVFLNDKLQNPSGFNLAEAGASALFINEVGYKNPAAPNDPQTWVRIGQMYNSSEYTDYATHGKKTNYGFYALADRQILQLDPSSPYTAYRGVYVGASAMYAPRETNIFTQYYEARLYGIALLPSRPKDMVSLVATHTVFSKYEVDFINRFAGRTGQHAADAASSITASYSAHLLQGVFLTGALSYTDNPSFVYIPGEGRSLVAGLNIALFF